jgi:hypothetical protein
MSSPAPPVVSGCIDTKKNLKNVLLATTAGGVAGVLYVKSYGLNDKYLYGAGVVGALSLGLYLMIDEENNTDDLCKRLTGKTGPS